MVESCTITLLVAPLLAFLAIALPAWAGKPLPEWAPSGLAAAASCTGTLAALAAFAGMLAQGLAEVRTPLGAWFSLAGYEFRWELVLDRLSLPFAALGIVLVGLIGAFSARYLHKEPGFTRFYMLLMLFALGVETVSLAGSLDLTILGWEVVGLTSALLIAFFNHRQGPVRHGLRAFVTYRLCDVGLLSATVWLHHAAGSTEVGALAQPWAGFVTPQGVADATIVGLLLLWATMGKSAQVPLGGWLPRAMEGPTPSSAIFYGALSIHLGPLLLLRASAILAHAPVAAAAVVAVGALTALHATFVGRVQTDIKSALAYASMTQVGLIFIEIGLGLHGVALAHIMGHACVRTLQILRSPSLLHDHHHLEMAMGQLLPRTGGHLERLVPRALQPWLYRHALERGYFDAFLKDHVVGGFFKVFRGLDRLERAWIRFLAHGASKAPQGAPRSAPVEGVRDSLEAAR
jgi:NADH:ubiquinone oxidoreductase subunit 5 (subunit L)/multisubunit Na+/H+ antiporter MnhA subunit